MPPTVTLLAFRKLIAAAVLGAALVSMVAACGGGTEGAPCPTPPQDSGVPPPELPAPQHLAIEETPPMDFSVEDGWVYWTAWSSDEGGVVRRTAADAPTSTLASQGDLPQAIAVGAQEVFWNDPPVVKAALLAGGQERLLSAEQGLVGDVALSGDALYIPSYSPPDSIARVALDGSSTTTFVADAGMAWRLSADDTHLYWLCLGESIRRASLATGEVTRLVESKHVSGIALRAGRLYYADNGAIAWLDADASDRGTILEDVDADLVAVDETHVYWSALPSGAFAPSMRILRAPLDGGVPELFAVARSVLALAIDDDSLYWIDAHASEIWRRGKR
jgi:hypothetical protein